MSSLLGKWLGSTLVILFFLQISVVISLGAWSDASYQELLVERLISQSPMAFVGLLFMLMTERLHRLATKKTFISWFIFVLAALFAIAFIISIPVAFSGNYNFTLQLDQSLNQRKTQFHAAAQQSKKPSAVKGIIEQLIQAGQLTEESTEEKKHLAAKEFIERQLSYMSKELKQAENQRTMAVNQRWLGGTISACVLFAAFMLLAFTAVM